MAFSGAVVSSVTQGVKQFQGVFGEMWSVAMTMNPPSIAAGAEDSTSVTIQGLRLGDMVLGFSTTTDPTLDSVVNFWISGSNTLSIGISNLNGASALDIASATWKILIGRPNW